jgi:hypothetical protein
MLLSGPKGIHFTCLLNIYNTKGNIMDTKKCQICGKTYSSRSKLKTHLKNFHNITEKEYFFLWEAIRKEKEGWVKCEVCDTYHKSNKFLEWHVKKIHNLTCKEYYYEYVMGLKEEPTCAVCNSELYFKNIKDGFTTFCSSKCREVYFHKHPELIAEKTKSRKKTCLEKYGVECISQLPDIKQKIQKTMKNTMQEKYGVDNPMQLPEFYDKAKKTMMEKYDVDNPSKVKEFQYKKIETSMKNHGVPFPNQSKTIREKIENTCVKKYGVPNPGSSEVVKEKIKKTCREKYGVENSLLSKEIQEKAKTTLFEKYGVSNAMQIPSSVEKTKQTFIRKYGKDHPLKTNEYKEKMVADGHWLSSEEKTAYTIYSRLAWRYTIRNLPLIENIEKRGKDYHIDHKFSIKEGFLQGIVPWIIGDICNLEILPAHVNIKKKTKCSISKDFLLTAYFSTS